MEDLKTLRERVRQRRAAFAKADQAYYQALQAHSFALQEPGGELPDAEEVEKKREEREDARFNLQAAINLLAQIGTPQELIREIPANLPFLLLPVRVEARYFTFRYVVRNLKPEDWIEAESIPGGAQYNRTGMEFDEEGTPTYQVPALHFSTNPFVFNPIRNQQFKPASNQYIARKADRHELCIRIYPDEIFTEGHEQALTPTEWEAGKVFWEKICTRVETEEAIWLNFTATIPPARASWIVRVTRPANFPQGGELPTTPQFSAPPPFKDGAYTLPPVAHLLPDRFVVRLYKGGQFKEFSGNPIAEPLRLGLDPTDKPFGNQEQAALFTGENAQLTAPEYLRWIHDLETAESMGLAIRVDLTNHPEYQDGVDKIFVLGAKFSADETESTRMLNAHLENCLYKEEGLAVLPQGTPTNNFEEQKSGFNRREAASLAYFRSEWLPEQPHALGLETDEMRLRRFLGLPQNFRLPGGHHTDMDEALHMNNLLWHATWGYYLLQFFTPALSEPKRELLRKFFSKYVSGRGALPVLRINRQPYGILPTTAFSYWAYPENNPEENFLSKLWTDFLSKLNIQWKGFSQAIQSVANQDTLNQRLDETFLNMLALSPSASRFQSQWLSGKGLKDLLTDLLAETDADLNKIVKAENDYAEANNKVSGAEAEIAGINSEIVGLQIELHQVFRASKAAIVRMINELKQRATALKNAQAGLKARRDTLKNQRDILFANKAALQQARSELAAAHAGISPSGNLKAVLEQAGIKGASFDAFTSAYTSFLQDMPRPVIDGLPLAEDRPLEKLPGKAWNYLEWLQQATLIKIWNNNRATAPAGDGSEDSKAGDALFALLARQATLRAVLETGLRMEETNPGRWLLKARNFDLEHLQPPIISLDPNALDPNNRLHQQYKPIVDAYKANLTAPFQLKTDRREYLPGIEVHTLANWLENAGANAQTQSLGEVETALKLFSTMPTARLERLFTEHLDLCSHRLDAWMLGLVHQRLDKQRRAKPEGIHLGAFGYLLGLKPNPQRAIVIEEVQPVYMPANRENFPRAAIPVVHSTGAQQWGINLAKNTKQAFFYIGDNPNPRLRLNGPANRVEPEPDANYPNSDGYLHLPSLAHASTAAILRAGYLGHRADTQTEALSINLNSPRVRQAMQLLEGMQSGGGLGEILGHYFERNLHENQLDRYRLDLRQVFPLKAMEGTPDTTLLGNLDGLALLKAYAANATGWLNQVRTENAQGQLIPIPPVDKQRLSMLAQALETNYLDATGDLLLAESVYQNTKGNTDRAAAAFRALNSGGQAPSPDFINTTQNGFGLTHRVGILFEQSIPGNNGAVWTTMGSPRVDLAPGLNRWLARQLPPPTKIAFSVSLPNAKKVVIKLANLEIEPLDLLYACPTTFRTGGQSALQLCVQLKANALYGTAENELFEVDFSDRTGFNEADVSIYEISALLASLRTLLSNSRAMTPADFGQPGSGDNGVVMTQPLQSRLLGYAAPGNKVFQLIGSLRNSATDLKNARSAGLDLEEIRSKSWLLFGHLFQAFLLGVEEAGAEGAFAISTENIPMLAEKAEKIAQELESRLDEIQTQFAGISSDTALSFKQLHKAAEALLGRNIAVIPELQLANARVVKTAYDGRVFLENAGSDALDHWLKEAALVRRPLAALRQIVLLRELFEEVGDREKVPIALQLPFLTGRLQPWIGGPVSEKELEKIRPEERANLSFVLEVPGEFTPDSAFSGLLVDEWPELIPSGKTDTGLAFQYNQPNTEPPQVILLATAPVEGGNWQWEHLMGAVEDALDLAKKRLVSPAQVRQNDAFARVLPAIALPFTPENKNIPVTELNSPDPPGG
ncbi:MAG: hypothetical protein SH848_00025 [Saprospiraceae bacterium]|nr:hypothetical protein [Saprospiraceae bacterium]